LLRNGNGRNGINNIRSQRKGIRETWGMARCENWRNAAIRTLWSYMSAYDMATHGGSD